MFEKLRQSVDDSAFKRAELRKSRFNVSRDEQRWLPTLEKLLEDSGKLTAAQAEDFRNQFVRKLADEEKLWIDLLQASEGMQSTMKPQRAW